MKKLYLLFLFILNIYVSLAQGIFPDESGILGPTRVCRDYEYTYQVVLSTAGCHYTGFFWNVIGGTIVGNSNSPTVRVRWNPGASSYSIHSYVSNGIWYDPNCGFCGVHCLEESFTLSNIQVVQEIAPRAGGINVKDISGGIISGEFCFPRELILEASPAVGTTFPSGLNFRYYLRGTNRVQIPSPQAPMNEQSVYITEALLSSAGSPSNNNYTFEVETYFCSEKRSESTSSRILTFLPDNQLGKDGIRVQQRNNENRIFEIYPPNPLPLLKKYNVQLSYQDYQGERFGLFTPPKQIDLDQANSLKINLPDDNNERVDLANILETFYEGQRCTNEFSDIAIEPRLKLNSVNISPIGCNNSKGAISLDINKAADILWNGPGGFSSTQKNISNLEPGIYEMTATYNYVHVISGPRPRFSLSVGFIHYDYQITETFVVEDRRFEVNQVTVIHCDPETGKGSISLDVNSPSGNFTYNWTGPTDNLPNGPTVSNLNPGTYSVIVKNHGQCEENHSFTIFEDISFGGVNLTAPSCFDGNDGSIALVPSGGDNVNGYYFYKDGVIQNAGNRVLSHTFEGLSGGTYNIRVEDENGCGRTENMTINNPLRLGIINIMTQSTSCYQTSTGSFSFNFVNNKGNISLSDISLELNGNLFPLAIDQLHINNTTSQITISDLTSGNYNVRIKDECNQWTSSSAIINQPANHLSFDVNYPIKTDLTCFEANDGTITVSANGGWGDFMYQIDNRGWQPSGNFTGLGRGVYNVRVIDRNGTGCEINTNVEINEPSSMELEVAGQYGAGPGREMGAAVITVRNGRLSGSDVLYSYYLDGNEVALPLCGAGDLPCYVVQSSGALYETIIIRNLSARSGASPYLLKAQTAPGCSVEQAFAIGTKTNPLVIGKVTVASMDDCSVPSGSILTELANADPGSLYNYNNIKSSYNHSETVPFTGQSLTVTVRDSIRGHTVSQQAMVLPGVSPVAIGQHVACHEGSDGKISFQISEGLEDIRSIGLISPGFVKTLDKDDISSDGQYITYKGHNIIEVEGLPAGTYQIEIITETGQGCTILSEGFTIFQPTLVERTGGQELNTGCFGLDDGFVRFNVAGGNGGFRAVLEERLSEGQWEVRDARTAVHNAVTGQEEIIFSGLKNTVGTTGYRYRIYDAQDCESQYHNFSVQGIERGLSVSISPQRPTCPDRFDGSLTANASGGQEGQAYIYEWYRTIDGDETALTETSGQLSGIEEGSYKVIVTDANGCTATEAFELISKRTHAEVGGISDYNGYKISCHGGENGAIALKVWGGSPIGNEYPYTFNVSKDNLTVLSKSYIDGNYTDFKAEEENIEYKWTGEDGLYEFINLRAGVYHFTFFDAALCDTTFEVDFNQPGPLEVSFNKGHPICYQGNGSYTITIDGGARYENEGYIVLLEKLKNADGTSFEGTFNYTVPAHQQSGDNKITYADNLPAGKYRITVKDQNFIESETVGNNASCWFEKEFYIIDPHALIVNVDGLTDPVCYQDENGGISASVNRALQHPTAVEGDDRDVVYLDSSTIFLWTLKKAENEDWPEALAEIVWQENSNSFFKDDLPEGVYFLSVTGPDNCVSINEAKVVLKDPMRLHIPTDSLNLVQYVPASCAYGADGEIHVKAHGGRPFEENFLYKYSLDNINYQEAEEITVNGITDYFFSIKNVPGHKNLDTLVYIMDGKGCTDTARIHWAKTDSIKTTYEIRQVTCADSSNASIRVNALGGTPFKTGAPYRYHWAKKDDNSFTANGTGPFLSNLGAGTYELTIKDSLECNPEIMVFEILAPEVFAIESTSIVNALPNRPDGSVHVRVNSLKGNGNYELYDREDRIVKDGTFSPSNFIINSLSAGNYLLKVYDPNSCEASMEIEIGERDIEFNFIAQAISCADSNDGQIEIRTNGGTQYIEHYEYAINEGLYGSSNVFEGLSEGTYTIYVREKQTEENPYPAEVASGDVVIETPNPLTVDFNKLSDYSCHSGPGEVQIEISGGTPPFTIVYSEKGGGGTSRSNVPQNYILALFAGEYDIRVTDSRGCEVEGAANIDEGPELQLTYEILHDPVCLSDKGVVQLSASGGAEGYSWYWNGAPGPDLREDLLPGSYYVTAEDGEGKKGSLFFVLNEGGGMAFENISVSPSGCGQSSGSLSFEVSGGAPPYTYQWAHDGTMNINHLENMAAGFYNVNISDNSGCNIQRTIYVPNEGTDALTYAVTTAPSCNAGTGTIEINLPLGETADYQLYLENELLAIEGAQAGGKLVYQGLASGNYTFQLSIDGTCTAGLSFILQDPSAEGLLISINEVESSSCMGTGRLEVSMPGDAGQHTYEWFTANGEKLDAATNALENVAPGFYKVIGTNESGCQSELELFVPEKQLPVLSIGTVTNTAFCHPSGSVDLIFGEGEGNGFSFVLTNDDGPVPDPAGPNFSGLEAGWYKAYALSGEGCATNEVCFFIDQKQEFEAVLLEGPAQDASCGSSSDGIVSFKLEGGTGPFNVLGIGDGQVDIQGDVVTISGLSAGNYDITIGDKDNCILNFEGVEIGLLGDPLDVFVSHYNPECTDAGNGHVEFLISGGRAPYQYDLYDGTDLLIVSGQKASEKVEGLFGGTYKLVLKDVAGCGLEEEIELKAPEKIVATLDQGAGKTKSPTCYHSSDGKLSINITGGTLRAGQDYTVQWHGFAETGRTLSAIPGGSYTVEISDSYNCKEVFTFDLPAPDTVTVNVVNVAKPSCAGNANGSIAIEIKNARAPYVTWTDQSGKVLNTTNTFTLSNLKAGVYTASIKDGNGCVFTSETMLEEPPALEIASETLLHPACFGEASGGIEIEISGGVPLDGGGYGVSWSNGMEGESISGLWANPYTVTVTDKNGCKAQKTYHLTNTPRLEIHNVVNKGLRCFGDGDGEISINVKGGSAPYTFLWGNGATAQDISGLSAGTYTVTVTDSKNCTVEGSFTVAGPNNLTVAPLVDNVTCTDNCDGGIFLRVSGGRTPYLIEWANGKTGDRASGLCPGTYPYKVTDANGCTITGEVEVTVPPVLRARLELNNGPSCAGGNNGTLRAVGEGGTAPYSYSWTSGPISATNNGLAAGAYGLTITDANGCTVNATYQVLDPPVFEVAEVLVSNVGCNGGNDGEVELIIDSEYPGLDISWSNGAGTRKISGLRAGTYNYTVRNSSNCQIEGSVTINQPAPISVQEIETVMPVCPSSCDGSLEVGANGGSGGYSYSWSNGMEGRRIENLCSGSYTVTVSDKNNCRAQRTFTIREPSPLRVLNTNVVQPTCTGFCNGSANLQILGGEAPYHVSWNDGATGHQRQGLCEGAYTATITDSRGCSQVEEIQIVYPAPVAVTGVPDFFELCLGGRRALDAGTGWQSYEWSSPNGFEAGTRRAEINRAGSYTLKTTSFQGCEAFHHFTVEVRETALIGDFVVTTTAIARDTVVLVDVSWPKPERVEWTVPEGVIVHSENGHEVQLIFRNEGAFLIGMTAFKDGCEAYTEKIVEALPIGSMKENNNDHRLGYQENILNATAYPNPSKGKFIINVKMGHMEEIKVSVLDIYRVQPLKEFFLDGKTEHDIEVEIENFSEGVYMVRIETPSTNKVFKINLVK